MHVAHLARSATLMQIIDVLRDEQHIAGIFHLQPGKRPVRRVRLHAGQRRAARIVEPQHQIGVAREPFGRRYVINAVVFP